jgi:thioredoxin-dependent peroxiredoxin
MRLKTGQLAPLFTQPDMYGRAVSLAQYRGRQVLLSFNRAAVCPLCNLRLHYLIYRYQEYRRRGLEIIAFFESSPDQALFFLERQGSPFPIVPDLGRAVYDLYGLESSFFEAAKAFFMRRPAFREAARYHIGGTMWQNITRTEGPMGRIQVPHYGRDAGDYLSFAEIEKFLSANPSPERVWPGYGSQR